MTGETLHWGNKLALIAGLLLACAGVAVSACGTQTYHPVSLAPYEGSVSWSRAIADWSRQHKVYDFTDDKLNARGTYHSPAFRKAFLLHRGEFFGDFANKAYKELVELGGGEAEHFHSFFISTYVGWTKYKAMTHSRTIWTISLVNDEGVKVVASKISDVPVNLSVQGIYPYVDRFDRAYMVRFPLVDKEGKPLITGSTRQFKLLIQSNYAQAELVWNLVPSSSPPDFGLPRDAGPGADAATGDEGGLGLGKLFGGGN